MTEQLFRAFQRGDQEAFKYFFQQSYKKIYRFILPFTVTPEDAEDIGADCFEKLWRNREKIFDAGHIEPWLYTTARNACIDHLRRRSKHEEGIEYLVVIATDENYIELIQTENNALEKVIRCMEGLGEKTRTALRLVYLEGLSYEEIAQRMDTTVQNVYQLRNRGVAELRRLLH